MKVEELLLLLVLEAIDSGVGDVVQNDAGKGAGVALML